MVNTENYLLNAVLNVEIEKARSNGMSVKLNIANDLKMFSNGSDMISVIIDSVLSKNPLLQTDKVDKKNHGKGISIVKSIAEKYGGDVVISEKNNEFIVSVILDNRIFT